MPPRVLFLTHPELDHLEYHIFDGLCRICGDENIVSYPLKRICYGEVADDYVLDSGQKGFTSPPEYILPRKKVEMSLEDIITNIDDFDFVISSPRTYATEALKVLRSYITQPLAILDGEDFDDLRWDIIEEFKPNIYFKREYVRDKSNTYALAGIPVLPCPFAAVDNTKPDINNDEKEISVFSVHGNTHPMRVSVTELLCKMNIPDNFVYIDINDYTCTWDIEPSQIISLSGTRLQYQNYLEKIAKSKISVSVRGWGRDSLRRFEIPLYETLLFTHDIGTVIPYPFEDGKTCVMFKNDLSDFKEKLEYYLEDENERIRIAKAGNKHLYKYHTTEARAKYVLGKMR